MFMLQRHMYADQLNMGAYRVRRVSRSSFLLSTIALVFETINETRHCRQMVLGHVVLRIQPAMCNIVA